jgi:transglutaminase-like putative cysteine protease
MLYAVSHRTVYRYETAASLSYHLAHLQPRETPRQRVLDVEVEVQPAPAISTTRTDLYGNAVTFLSVDNPHTELRVVATSRVRVAPANLPAPGATPPWETVRDACASDVLDEHSQAGEFMHESPRVAPAGAYAGYAAESFLAGRPLLDALCEFTARIYRDFRFDPRATTVATPVAEVFRNRRGVCQDFAHLGIACLRSLGRPARYVSGYLETQPPAGRQRLVGADASHAWYSVWCPGFGWIDADPTNNLLPGDRHLTVAWGRDYSDVSPLRGVVVGGGEHELDVGVDMVRIEDSTSA